MNEESSPKSSVTLSITIDPEKHEVLQTMASVQGCSIEEIVSGMIDERIDQVVEVMQVVQPVPGAKFGRDDFRTAIRILHGQLPPAPKDRRG